MKMAMCSYTPCRPKTAGLSAGRTSSVSGKNSFTVNHIIDLSRFENKNKFLEGTGSMVLDRQNKIAYACLSPVPDENVLSVFCDYTGYACL
jgi:hypothetical protein